MSLGAIDQKMLPRVKRTIERIELGGGGLIFMRAFGGDVEVGQVGTADRELLDALDGRHSVAELEGRFGGTVGGTLEQLMGLELIEDARDDELVPISERERFDRQLRYFGDIARPGGVTPSEGQLRLRGARVAILGVGGLGGRVAMDLASVGVGELWLADGDRVEVSNLNRQIQFDEADVGLIKVERMAARLRSFNSATTVDARAIALEHEEQIAEFIGGADLVVDAADWPTHEIERRCNSACFALGIPYITMSHFPPVARVGPLYVPGATGCFNCQEIAYRREYEHYDLTVEQRRGRTLPTATLGPACGFVAGLVAADAMHFLTGLLQPGTLGAGFVLDLRTFTLERYEVVREPGCAVCGSAATDAPRGVAEVQP